MEELSELFIGTKLLVLKEHYKLKDSGKAVVKVVCQTVQCALCTVHCALCTVHVARCTVCTVHCAHGTFCHASCQSKGIAFKLDFSWTFKKG